VKLDVEVPAFTTFSLGSSSLFFKRRLLEEALRKFDEGRLVVKRLVEHDVARRTV
jgi:hypothetical protein